MISRLVITLGNSDNLKVNYGADGSGAKDKNVKGTFNNFGYNSGGVIKYDQRTILSEVLQGRPVYVGGYATRKDIIKIFGWRIITSYGKGHAWVIDAVLRQTANYYEYDSRGKLIRTTPVLRDLVHCNWGWNGLSDGYYFSGAFNTKKGPDVKAEYDYGAHPEGLTFQYKFEMITGISPRR
jgi:hypothetical protein